MLAHGCTCIVGNEPCARSSLNRLALPPLSLNLLDCFTTAVTWAVNWAFALNFTVTWTVEPGVALRFSNATMSLVPPDVVLLVFDRSVAGAVTWKTVFGGK